MAKSNKQSIIKYYDQSEIDYKLVWGLNRNLALHYGYWDSTTKNLSQALAKENQVLADLAKIKKSDQVLDAGCGVGGSSIYLAQKIGCHITGITVARNQVKSARENAQKFGVEKFVNFQIGDYSKTKFKNNSFNIFWAIESSCYSSSTDLANESFRLLKIGGRLIVADFFVAKPKLDPKQQNLMDKMASGWAIDSFNQVNEFKLALQKAGFKKIRVINATENILPSAKRLYYASYPGIIVGKLLEILKIRTNFQNANVWTVYHQYHALKQNLWNYYIFLAEK